MKEEIIISGSVETRKVFFGSKELDPAVSQKVYNHSPDGFAWGYSGSGAAQLALAILLECDVPKGSAVKWHQDFKMDVVAVLSGDEAFKLPKSIVDNWIEKRRLIESEDTDTPF